MYVSLDLSRVITISTKIKNYKFIDLFTKRKIKEKNLAKTFIIII